MVVLIFSSSTGGLLGRGVPWSRTRRRPATNLTAPTPRADLCSRGPAPTMRRHALPARDGRGGVVVPAALRRPGRSPPRRPPPTTPAAAPSRRPRGSSPTSAWPPSSSPRSCCARTWPTPRLDRFDLTEAAEPVAPHRRSVGGLSASSSSPRVLCRRRRGPNRTPPTSPRAGRRDLVAGAADRCACCSATSSAGSTRSPPRSALVDRRVRRPTATDGAPAWLPAAFLASFGWYFLAYHCARLAPGAGRATSACTRWRRWLGRAALGPPLAGDRRGLRRRCPPGRPPRCAAATAPRPTGPRPADGRVARRHRLRRRVDHDLLGRRARHQPGWSRTLLNTVGLVWVTAIVAGRLSRCARRRVAERGADRAASTAGLRRRASCRWPPAWFLAHYLTLLLLEGQNFYRPISDPIGRGWDLFGTDQPHHRLPAGAAAGWLRWSPAAGARWSATSARSSCSTTARCAPAAAGGPACGPPGPSAGVARRRRPSLGGWSLPGTLGGDSPRSGARPPGRMGRDALRARADRAVRRAARHRQPPRHPRPRPSRDEPSRTTRARLTGPRRSPPAPSTRPTRRRHLGAPDDVVVEVRRRTRPLHGRARARSPTTSARLTPTPTARHRAAIDYRLAPLVWGPFLAALPPGPAAPPGPGTARGGSRRRRPTPTAPPRSVALTLLALDPRLPRLAADPDDHLRRRRVRRQPPAQSATLAAVRIGVLAALCPGGAGRPQGPPPGAARVHRRRRAC